MAIINRYTGIGGGIQVPDKLIIHAMAEFIKLDEDLELKRGTVKAGVYHAHEWLGLLGLSAHFLIEPNGDIIKQRSTKEICYHAKGYNVNSVGIEVLVDGVWNYGEFIERIKEDYVTESQYKSLVGISNDVIEYFDNVEVARHSDLSPDRKQDPGSGFKWEWYKKQLI